MELTEKYLDSLTLMADFWVADDNKQIKKVFNEGIVIKKSKIYLNKWFIDIIMKEHIYEDFIAHCEGWEKRFPKAVITKASNNIEAYDLTFKKVVPKDNCMVVLEFAADLIKD